MAGRANVKAMPISIAVSKEQRAGFEAEARRRGLGVSSTIRTLALERADELRRTRQVERATRWRETRMRRLIDRIEAGKEGEASQAEIDALFDR